MAKTTSEGPRGVPEFCRVCDLHSGVKEALREHTDKFTRIESEFNESQKGQLDMINQKVSNLTFRWVVGLIATVMLAIASFIYGSINKAENGFENGQRELKKKLSEFEKEQRTVQSTQMEKIHDIKEDVAVIKKIVENNSNGH